MVPIEYQAYSSSDHKSSIFIIDPLCYFVTALWVNHEQQGKQGKKIIFNPFIDLVDIHTQM